MLSEVQNRMAVDNSLISLYDYISIHDLVCDAGKAAHSLQIKKLNKNMVTLYCGSTALVNFCQTVKCKIVSLKKKFLRLQRQN